MTVIDRYLGTRIVSTLLKTVLAFIFLYALIDLITTRQSSIEKYDVSWSTVLLYYIYNAPAFVFKFQTLALALLIATLFVLGKAAQDMEITALLSGGVSLPRIARVPILIALALTLGVFGFENTVGTVIALRAEQIDMEHFRRATNDEGRGPSWTRLGDENWTCHILRFNREALTGTDVFIHAFLEGGKGGMEEIRAKRIYWDPDMGKWILEDGRWASIRRNPDIKNETRITQIVAPFDETPEMLFALEADPDTKSASALYEDLRNAEAMGVPTTRSRVAFQTKFARPALCFVIVWLAIPFALRIRRGGIFLSFGLSIALGLAYITVYVVAIGLGNIGLLPPMVAAWLANGVFLLTGIVLFRRMGT